MESRFELDILIIHPAEVLTDLWKELPVKSQRHWHVEDIKAELRKRYGSLSALSRKLGLQPGTVSAALSKPGMSRKLEQQIAELLQEPPHVLWPERWSSDGSPISFRVDRTPSRTASDALRAKRSAA